MVMVAVGAAVDYLLRSAVIGAGITLDVKLFFGMLITVWLTINELISVMENLAAIGVPGVSAFAAHFKAAPSHRGG